jgi:hypothetical protein
MKYLLSEIIEYTDDHFPGWVRCVFIDAYERQHEVCEKVPIVSWENIVATTVLPLRGYLAGEIVSQNGNIVCFNLEKPYYIESTDGESIFHVLEKQIIDR